MEQRSGAVAAFADCADGLDPGVLSYACPIYLPRTEVIYSVGIVALKRRLMDSTRVK